MLAELARFYGSDLAGILGVPVRTLDAWRDGSRFPGLPAVRLVWLVWVLVLHPELVREPGDLLTWGRFARRAPQ